MIIKNQKTASSNKKRPLAFLINKKNNDTLYWKAKEENLSLTEKEDLNNDAVNKKDKQTRDLSDLPVEISFIRKHMTLPYHQREHSNPGNPYWFIQTIDYLKHQRTLFINLKNKTK